MKHEVSLSVLGISVVSQTISNQCKDTIERHDVGEVSKHKHNCLENDSDIQRYRSSQPRFIFYLFIFYFHFFQVYH